jgi:hypothetical protein
MTAGNAAAGERAAPPLQFASGRQYSVRGFRSGGTIAVYAALLVVLAIYGYWRIFSTWATFDDEGFFVYSLKTFLAGHHLYGSTYSEYGPFYYGLFGVFFKLAGLSVSDDTGRFITIFCWLASSVCIGLTAHRFTKSLWIGLFALVASYLLMTTFTEGPMHPEILVALLTALLGATVLLAVPRFDRLGPSLVGFLVAGMALTKINVGVYLVVAIAFAYLLVDPPRLFQRLWLRVVVTAVFVLLGLILMRSELDVAEERNYALCYGLSAAALALAAWPRSGSRTGNRGAEQIAWAALGFGVCTCVTLAVAFVFGMNAHAWIVQTIVTPLHQGKFLNGYVPVSDVQLALGLIGAIMARRVNVGSATVDRIPWAPGVARLIVGLVILAAAAAVFPFSRAGYPYQGGWAFVWIIACPPASVRHEERLARVMLAALAISQSLLGYPVPGSQVPLGDLLFVLCGGVALGDAITSLRGWGVRLPAIGGRRTGAITTAAIALAALAAYQDRIGSQLSMGKRTFSVYSAPIKGIGASDIRIAQPWLGGINSVIAKVRDEHCKYLMEIPGIYSMNLWTGLKTPDPLTGEQPYWEVLSAQQRQQVLEAARAASGLCVIRNHSDLEFYMRGRALPKDALMNYLTGRTFKRVGTYSGWSVWVRRARG